MNYIYNFMFFGTRPTASSHSFPCATTALGDIRWRYTVTNCVYRKRMLVTAMRMDRLGNGATPKRTGTRPNGDHDAPSDAGAAARHAVLGANLGREGQIAANGFRHHAARA